MKLKDKIKDLKPYNLNCNVFDVYNYNGLSMQDLFCQFFHKINECVDTSNKTLELSEWLVNEGLEKEIAEKLILWYEDGTLEELINVALFENLNEKISDVNLKLNQITVFNTSDLQEDINNFNNEGKLHIKEGVYRLNKKIGLKSNMVLSGKFNKTVFKLSEDADKTASLLYGEDIENIVIENIVFDGFGANRNSELYYHGGVEGSNRDMKIVDVELKNCKNVTIKNCVFTEAIYGSIRLTNCENVNFENNIILSSYGHGLIVDKSYNCFISNNRIFNCGKDNKYPLGLNGCGICFIDQTPLNETSHTNIVTSNIIGNCREAGISYEGHRRIISNNIIFNSGKEKSAIKSMSHTISNISNHNDFRRKQHLITGNMIIGSMSSEKGVNISIHATGSDVQISNNFIYNRSNEDYILAKENNVFDSHSIYIQMIHDGGVLENGDTRNIFVDNNYIKNCCGRGIFVTGGYDKTTNLVELKNNKVINCLKSGIVTSLTNGLHIEGNLVQNCAVQSKDDERPIFINTEKRRLILNDNKVIFDDLEIPFENKLKNATDGNIELNYCTLQNCQINRNIITGNYSNAIKLINTNVNDLQINENMIKPHSTLTAEGSCSGIIIHTGSNISRFICSNNNIIQCNNRAIYLRNISSGVVTGNITDEASQLVYLHSNVGKCSITSNVGGQIGMAGSSNNTNNLIANNIVSGFGFIDTSNNKVVNNNIEY